MEYAEKSFKVKLRFERVSQLKDRANIIAFTYTRNQSLVYGLEKTAPPGKLNDFYLKNRQIRYTQYCFALANIGFLKCITYIIGHQYVAPLWMKHLAMVN